MGNRDTESETDAVEDEPEFQRRQVLAGIGGTVAAGSVAGLGGGRSRPDDLAERWAEQFAGVTTAEDRAELEFLVEEMETDAEILATHDLDELDPAKRQEFAEKGRRLRNMMDGDCGFEGWEVDGGKYDGCCTVHDICESINDEPDHVFNGDACDDSFWSCVSNA